MDTIEVCIPLDSGSCREARYRLEGNVVYFDEEEPFVLFKHAASLRVLCEGSSMQVFHWAGVNYTLWRITPRGKCIVLPGSLEDRGDHYVHRSQEAPGELELRGYAKLLILLLRLKGYTPIVVENTETASKLVNLVYPASDELNKAKISLLLNIPENRLQEEFISIMIKLLEGDKH